jgi:hypothetical protein
MRTSDEHDDLDLLLDAALAKRAAVEPRAGLDDRILANLHAEQARVSGHAWWKWALVPIAAVIVGAVALALRPESRPRPVIVKQAAKQPAATQSRPAPESQLANREAAATREHPVIRRTRVHRVAPPPVVAATPKLDQFPSPQPLSEQEKMLMGYIEQNSETAGLLAKARMDSLRQDEEEQHKRETEDQRSTQ